LLISGSSIAEYPRHNRSLALERSYNDDSTRNSEMPALRHGVHTQQSQSKILLIPVSLEQSQGTTNA